MIKKFGMFIKLIIILIILSFVYTYISNIKIDKIGLEVSKLKDKIVQIGEGIADSKTEIDIINEQIKEIIENIEKIEN